MKQFTLSSVELATHCLYPFRKDVETPAFEGNEFSIRGSACHAAIEAILTKQPRPELDDLGEQFIDRFLNRYRKDDFGFCMPELAMAINKITGDVRCLGAGIDREYAKYGATDDEICGSIDLTSNPAGIITVWEWKFGRQYHLTRFQNPQAEAYAALIGRWMGLEVVRACTVVIDEDGVREYEQTITDFDRVLQGILDLSMELELSDPAPRPGEHCKTKYCPAAATCPALTEISTDMLKHTSTAIPLATKADVGRTIERLLAMEAQAEAIWKLVDARAKELGEDIELSNGKLYGMKESHRESVLATDECREFLKEKLGPGIDEAVKVSITKDSIRAAVKLIAPKGKAASVFRGIEESLRDMGVVKESTSTNLGIK